MKTSLYGAAVALALTASASQAQSLPDVLAGRAAQQSSVYDRDVYDRDHRQLYDRDPVGDVLRLKRELSLSKSQESRLKDIRKDLEKRNRSLYRTVDQLEKRIRDDDRRDDRYDRDGRDDRDGRYDRDGRDDRGRYDNRSNNGGGWAQGNGRYDDRVTQQQRAQLQRAVLQIRSNNQRAMQQVRNVLSTAQERRLGGW